MISVSGPDAPKFLQGIITSSILSADGRPRDTGFYTAFLNATGRVLYDVFIYPDSLVNGGKAGPGESFLIEVDASEAQRLAAHIKRYKLRAKFNVRLLEKDELTVWQAWDEGGGSGLEAASQASDGSGIQMKDTRAPGLGYRLIRAGSEAPQLDLDSVSEEAYQIRRYLNGVPEGQEEIPREHSLPLDSNVDLMGGIDFRKGCYVGQELTIRTKHRGVVRKRILPCILYAPDKAMPDSLAYHPSIETSSGLGDLDAAMIPSDTSIGRFEKRGRSAGKWLKGVGNIGLALCRLEIMTDVVLPGETAAAAYNPEDEFIMQHKLGEDREDLSVKIKAFVPDWLRQGLDAPH